MILIWFAICLAWLGYETDWFRVRLPIGKSVPLSSPLPIAVWLTTFAVYTEHNVNLFIPRPDYSYVPACKHYKIELSCGVKVMCGQKWLDKHYHDLDDYHPEVELYFGNGYKQTFTLKKPELMGKIVKINTGKRYFKQLMEVT